LLEKLLEHFDTDTVNRRFRDFNSIHGEEFANDDDDDEESSHKQFSSFKIYESMFANELEAFAEDKGLKEEDTIEALYRGLEGGGDGGEEVKGGEGKEVENDMDGDFNAETRDLVHNLLAALDFGAFKELMKKEEKKNAKAREDAEMLGF